MENAKLANLICTIVREELANTLKTSCMPAKDTLNDIQWKNVINKVN